ncbi:hypothetical protein MHBO_002515 [Bonamia ostreae]|uniref:Uncharacterized protein n=1 Tax=Bonamia ostreae TaxID=126728 RepID=A0ABV2AMM4_9EUKA
MDKIEKINKKDIFKTGNIFEGNIADHVKFHFNEATDSSAAENGKTEQNELINPKIVELFQLLHFFNKSIGRALKQLHQGNLPKAMKAVPNLTNWEEIIDIANPFEWTPYAVQSVTKMFASNLKSEMAETFKL